MTHTNTKPASAQAYADALTLHQKAVTMRLHLQVRINDNELERKGAIPFVEENTRTLARHLLALQTSAPVERAGINREISKTLRNINKLTMNIQECDELIYVSQKALNVVDHITANMTADGITLENAIQLTEMFDLHVVLPMIRAGRLHNDLRQHPLLASENPRLKLDGFCISVPNLGI